MKKSIIIIFIFFITISAIAQDVEWFIGEKIPAVVNTDQVNVRDNYSLTSDILFTVNKGEYVYITGRTTEKERIGHWESVWYRVSRPRGDEFWIYGEFVSPLGSAITHGNRGGNTEYFCYIQEGEFPIADGIYRCSERYRYTSYESLSITPGSTNLELYEVIVFNNTMAVFIDGELAPLNRGISFLPSHISVAESWYTVSNHPIGYDYLFQILSERTGGGDYYTLGFIENRSISVESSSNHFGSSSTSIITYSKDYEGEIRQIEWKPPYPLEYLSHGDESLALYSSPNTDNPMENIEIPCWKGDEEFSNWQEFLNDMSYESFSQLNFHELPIFSVVDRMEGNDLNDPRKRWYKVIYQGITGYILVEPETLSTEQEYRNNIDLNYFGP